MNLTELKHNTLVAEGFSGNTTEMYHQWLLQETGVVNDASVNDLLMIYLNIQLVPEMQLNDRLKTWYVLLGLGTEDEHINELEYRYWQDRAP
ncbi:hypothetical protein N9100_01690 [Gammaproteobacteria bacterium]|nr:hypothetical protein [Gammaproteobacteria bacterium]